jgi:hypothetical protein
MKKPTISFALLTMAFFLLPTIIRARDYSANTGRFLTLDTYEGNKQSPQSLHKYTYTENDPVNRVDPSGHAAYFVERKFDAWYGYPTWPLDYGHGYLLFTATSDPGTGDPFSQPGINTFSWHPYKWDFDHNAIPGVPGRVWEDNPSDTHPSMLHHAYPITTDPGQQAALLNYVNGWIHTSKPGYDYGSPIPDPNDLKGNQIGDPSSHVPASPGGVFYSLYGQNCVWWSTAMLKGSGVNVPQNVYDTIRGYNHGAGYARYVISGARSRNTFGVLDLSGCGYLGSGLY